MSSRCSVGPYFYILNCLRKCKTSLLMKWLNLLLNRMPLKYWANFWINVLLTESLFSCLLLQLEVLIMLKETIIKYLNHYLLFVCAAKQWWLNSLKCDCLSQMRKGQCSVLPWHNLYFNTYMSCIYPPIYCCFFLS